MKILYFYISNNLIGFQSFNVHINEFIEHANMIEGVEVVGWKELAHSKPSKTMGVYGKVMKYLPRFVKDLLALSSNLSDYLFAVKRIKEVKPDVILFRHNFMNIYQIFLKKRFNIPVMLEVNSPLTYERRVHKDVTLHWLSWLAEKWSWKSADKIYVVSNALKKILEKTVDSQKIIPIHNGGNPSYYKGIVKTPSSRIRVGFVGSFQKYHGIDILFETIPSVLDKYSNVEFCLIGKGVLYEEYKEFFRNKPQYKERVLLKGYVNFKDIPQELVNFDIAMMMDFTEYGSPLKLFEYMLARCSILLPDRETIHEVMEEEEDCLLFKPRDGKDFENQLYRLIEDQDLRNRLAENAYKKVVKSYTWMHNATKVVNELKVLNKDRSVVRSLSL